MARCPPEVVQRRAETEKLLAMETEDVVTAMKTERTQVVIVGAGPAGMLLGHILTRCGIDNVVLERQSKAHVLQRIRAGVLEAHSVEVLRRWGLADRLDAVGAVKDGSQIVWQDRPGHFIDVRKWTGSPMFAYGQTMLTEDLYAARARSGEDVSDEVTQLTFHDLATANPWLTYERGGQSHRLDCDFVAGCDGFQGLARGAIPQAFQRNFGRVYPFAWLGIMVQRPPIPDFTYAYHATGMALAAQRNPMLSRYYIQVPLTEKIEDWPDDRFWETLSLRFPSDLAARIQTGPSIEKSIAPLRSFVSEPMRHGRLFLAGDAAHIVPPTGAKGLNLAISDIHFLSTALIDRYQTGSDTLLESYSATALRRVWAAELLSWRLTNLLHPMPEEDAFAQRLRQAEYDTLLRSEAAQQALALDYAGVPYL